MFGRIFRNPVRSASYGCTTRIICRNSRVFRERRQYQYFDNRHQTLKERLFAPRMLIIYGGIGLAGGYYVFHLENVEITGRRRMMDVTEAQELALGKAAFASVMENYRGQLLPPNHKYVNAVRDVGLALVNHSGIERIKHFQWEFVVVDDPTPNAFVLPGGKVVVFTGIIPVMGNRDGLAVVLGHEIAHVVARHQGESLSFRKYLIGASLILATIFESTVISNWLVNMLMNLPFSRMHETEADHIGLVLMARACFNLREAPRFWRRMQEANVPELMTYVSTHPSHSSRVKQIERLLPAMEEEMHKHCVILKDLRTTW